MKTEHITEGASFITVLCGLSKDLTRKGCNGRGGSKWLFDKHKGYDSNGGTEMTAEEISLAEEVAVNHEMANPTHDVRVVVGHLEGTVYDSKKKKK